MTLFAVSVAAEVCAAVSAVALARRRPAYVPAAVALVLLAAVPFLDGPVHAALAPLPRPITGPALVLVYLDGAINLATSAIVAGKTIRRSAA